MISDHVTDNHYSIHPDNDFSLSNSSASLSHFFFKTVFMYYRSYVLNFFEGNDPLSFKFNFKT